MGGGLGCFLPWPQLQAVTLPVGEAVVASYTESPAGDGVVLKSVPKGGGRALDGF